MTRDIPADDVITAAWRAFDARRAHGEDSDEYRRAPYQLEWAQTRARMLRGVA